MAEVPGSQYEPYFTAQPTERPIQLRGVDVPSGAFGENIASAVSTFGGDIEKASNEVFNRAMALRRLQVDGNIRDLTTAYYNEVSPIQTDYLTKKGSNAGPDAQAKHLADIETIRQRYLDQSKQFGVYGADRFGAEAASMQRSFIREATVHSAVETKSALKDTHKARIATLQDQARGERDPERLKDINKKIEAEQAAIGTMDGDSPDKVAFDTRSEISKSNTQNTIGSMRRDPTNATAIGNAAIKGGRVDAAGQDAILREGQATIHTGANVWHQRLLDGRSATLGNRKVDPDRLVNTIYELEGRTRGPLITNPKSDYYGQRALPGGVMPGNLKEWLKDAGMSPMTEDEYANNPAAQRQLMKFKLNEFQERYGNANDAASMWFTGSPVTPASMRRTDAQPGTYTGIAGNEYIRRFNAALAKNASAAEVGAAAKAHGDSVSNETFPDTGEQYRQIVTDRQYAEESRQKRAGYENDLTISQAISNGNPQTKQPYRSYEDFAADPNNTQTIANGMATNPNFVAHTARMIKGYNDAFMVRTDIGHKHDLLTMMTDEPAKFLEQSFFDDKKLSQRDQIYFNNQKAQLVRKGFVDPNANHAYADLANMYPNEVPVKSSDEEGYKNYKGRLFIAMQAWEEVNKKPLKFGTPEGGKALKEIHQMLMEQTPGWFGFKRASYRVEPDVPEEFTKGVKLANPQATDDEVRYNWIKGQNIVEFERLYSKKDASSPAPSVHLRPNTIRGSVPATPAPATPATPQPPAPSIAEQAQSDPVIQFLQKLGGRAVGEWLQQVAKETMAGGTPGSEAAQVRELGGKAKADMAQKQKEAAEERERELPPEVIGRPIK